MNPQEQLPPGEDSPHEPGHPPTPPMPQIPPRPLDWPPEEGSHPASDAPTREPG